MRTFTAALFALLLWSCKKDTSNSIAQPAPTSASLKTDVSTMTLASPSGSKDSFNVSSNIKWSIAVNPSTATWLTISATSGSNNGKIYVSANSDNSSSKDRSATIVLSPVETNAVSADTIVVAQNHAVSSFMTWQVPLGGTGIDLMNAVAATPDGGCIMAGSTSSNNGNVTGLHGEDDFWVVKLNSAGAIEWQKALGGSSGEEAYSIIPTSDGGYAVTGYTASVDGDVSPPSRGGDFGDLWVAKLNSQGTIAWQKALGGSQGDYARSVIETADGSLVVAGYTLSNDGDVSGNRGLQDAWVIKFSNTGDVIWKKLIGGSDGDWAVSIVPTTDGGYAFAGYSRSTDGDVSGNHGDMDCWVVKLDSAGGLSWQKSFGGSGFEYFTSIATTPDGDFIAVGTTSSTDGDLSGDQGEGAWAVKLSSGGDILWQKILGSYIDGIANGVTVSPSGEYAIAGSQGSDAWVIKLGSDGSVLKEKILGGSQADYFNAITTVNDGSFVAVGNTASNDSDVSGYHGGNYDAWAVKFKFQ